MIKLNFGQTLKAAVVATSLCALGAVAQAADYPDRAISVIVPLPAGSAADGIARIVLPAVEKILGQSLIIENQGGAAHIPGMARAAKQEGNGYNLVWATIADFSSNPNLYAELPFDPGKDFVPISRVSAQSLILAVPTASGTKSVEELIAKAKASSMSYASTGIGNSNHLLGEMLMQDSGIELRHIPYQGGSPAVLDLMRGEVDMMFYSLSKFQPGIQSGELTLLGLTAAERSKFLPDLPTMRELGYGDVLVTSWNGLFAPAGTSKEQIDIIFDALSTVLKDPTIIQALENTGTEVWASESPAEFEVFLTKERARYGKLIDSIGLEKR